MATQDMSKVKEGIVEFLKNNGPSLPISIAKHAKVESLFASAFLSELLSNQKIKMSNMKVGSSPVYYIPGTEAGLEKYSEYLKSKEKEAYLLLKEHKFLDDSEEHPAIRVALREIKDFAKHFEFNGKLIWRYFLTPQSEYNQKPTTEPEAQNEEVEAKENITPNIPNSILSDVKKILEPKISLEEKPASEPVASRPEAPKKTKEDSIQTITEKPKELERISPTYGSQAKQLTSFSNPLAQKIEIKKPKEKPKSPFVISVMEFIIDNNWIIIEEISHKAKEYNALVKINSDLGPIIFMTQAKDKKTVSDADFIKLLGEAQRIPLPALFLAKATPKKKAQDFLDKYTSVLKYRKIE